MNTRNTLHSLATFSFIAPSLIEVSADAFKLARAFFEQASREKLGEDWIVTFDWSNARRVRRTPGGAWEDLGAGLDIAVYRRQQIPANAVEIIDSVPVAFKIPRDVFERSLEKRIDLDHSGASRVRLI